MANQKNKKIGYKQPPKSGQFKKGQSGNPAGRPKGTKNLRTVVDTVANETVDLRENDKVKKVSKQLAIVKSLSAKAMQGDVRATTEMIKLIERYIEQPTDEMDFEEEPLSQTDAEIFADYEEDIRKRVLARIDREQLSSNQSTSPSKPRNRERTWSAAKQSKSTRN